MAMGELLTPRGIMVVGGVAGGAVSSLSCMNAASVGAWVSFYGRRSHGSVALFAFYVYFMGMCRKKVSSKPKSIKART
jgi:hypothetical protein